MLDLRLAFPQPTDRYRLTFDSILRWNLRWAIPFILASTFGLGSTPTIRADEPSVDAPVAPAEAGGPLAANDGAAGQHPFPRRLRALDFPEGLTWLNTDAPYQLKDFRGRFFLLDFWTYCCINCMHVLPELKELEHRYPHELAVVGVHCAKFDTEKEQQNIEEAILRYEIDHPVVNDANHSIWEAYGIRSWPTILLIDPLGDVVYYQAGEFQSEDLIQILDTAMPFYRQQGVLADKPLGNARLAETAQRTPLRFPGKVLADEAGDRLFISDSNHNRIVISTLDGRLTDVIGTGEMGHVDGGFDVATFDHPQGVALHGETLYVADTENHLIRKVDLTRKQVATIAGVGTQARVAFPGMDKVKSLNDIPDRWVGAPRETALNSPWALWVHEPHLYVAMAGPHQIWRMPLDESEIGPYAGNSREDIVDGPLLPKVPYDLGFASFAQPSGLTSDGQQLFVADSEGSSIRSVPFDAKEPVRTVVGTADLAANRLFTFGDVDGPLETARLQHALGVTHHDGRIYVADTYNNKVKAIDLAAGNVATLAGTGEPGKTDMPPLFDEPAGISYGKGRLYVADTNNHVIRMIELNNENRVTTLAIAGLDAPPASTPKKRKPAFPGAAKVAVKDARVRSVDGKIKLVLDLKLPAGWKMNAEAPMRYLIELKDATGVIDRAAVGEYLQVKEPRAQVELTLPVSGDGKDIATVSLNYYYCQDAENGVCKTGAVIWTVPLEVSADAESDQAILRHAIDAAK